MRAARAVLAAVLLLVSWPSSAQVAAVEAARAAAVPRVVPVAGPWGVLPSLPAAASAPALTPSLVSAPLSAAPLPVVAAPAAASPADARARLTAAARASSALTSGLSRSNGETASDSAERSFRVLLGGETPSVLAAAEEGPESPRPSGLSPARAPLDPGARERARQARRMIAGTAVMKTGMETVTLSVPLLVLSGLGGPALVAALVVAYGAAQAVFAGAAGGLMERLPPQKVLSSAVAAQGALVAAVIVLGAAHLLGVATLFPLYVLIGGAVGVIETSRQSIPARLLGRDEEALKGYNARLHILYETAGVAGALAAGALIATVGPLWSLALTPPAYAAAAWIFARVRLPERPRLNLLRVGGTLRERAAAYWSDVRAGARLVVGDPRLRWLAVAFVLPQVAHRVLEGLLLPVFAKTVLGHPSFSAYLLTASNLGELIGAALLLRFANKVPGPVWVKRAALGLLLAWGLATTHFLPVLLALVVGMSGTWSSSDLALRSDLQSSLGDRDLPRATSFLFGAFVVVSAAASLALGGLFDLLAPGAALAWVCALYTAIGAATFLASRRLAASKR